MRFTKLLGIIMLFVAMLTFSACGGDEEGGGVCIADFGIIVECFDCWDEGDCDDAGYDWRPAADSCSSLGYTSPTSNNCGYTS